MTDLTVTKHFQRRAGQRGIPGDLMRLALSLGDQDHRGRVILGRRQIQRVRDEIRVLDSALGRVQDKGGLVIVEEAGMVITGYGMHRKGRGRRAAG